MLIITTILLTCISLNSCGFIFDPTSGLTYEEWGTGRETEYVTGTSDVGTPPETASLRPSFAGYDLNSVAAETGFLFIPPDPSGAVGPDIVISVGNVVIQALDKKGNLLWTDSLRDFFSPLALTFTFDPKIVYDQYRKRFVVITLDKVDPPFGAPNVNNISSSQLLLAVSTSEYPATDNDWYFLAINAKETIDGFDVWADYPGFEVDQYGVYVTANLFRFVGGFAGTRFYAIPKTNFYSGQPVDEDEIKIYDPFALSGATVRTTLQPSQLFGDQSDNTVYLVAYSGLTDFDIPSQFVGVIAAMDVFSDNAQFELVFVPLGNIECVTQVLPDAPQAGGDRAIEVNDRRALDAVIKDNQIWMTFEVDLKVGEVNGTCVSAGVTKAYYVQLDVSLFPNVTVVEQQVIDGVGIQADVTNISTFFPSVVVDRNNVGWYGFSASSPTMYGGAFLLNSRTGETKTVKEGEDYYLLDFARTRNRWGDYTGIALDPKLKCGKEYVWAFSQYALPAVAGSPGFTGRWGTYWGRALASRFPDSN